MLIIAYIGKCMMNREGYEGNILKASIVTQKQTGVEGKLHGSPVLLHFEGKQSAPGENFDITQIGAEEGIFQERDIHFINKQYKGPEGKKLINKFLNEPESFPDHLDIEKGAKTNFAEYDSNLVEAQESSQRANDKVRELTAQLRDVEKQVSEKRAIGTQYRSQIDTLSQQIAAANNATTESNRLALAESAKLDDQGFLLGKFINNAMSSQLAQERATQSEINTMSNLVANTLTSSGEDLNISEDVDAVVSDFTTKFPDATSEEIDEVIEIAVNSSLQKPKGPTG